LLQSCCGPCSSYCIEALSKYFLVTVLWYNPNIQPENEHNLRLENQIKLIKNMKTENPVEILEIPYNDFEFLEVAKGFEEEKEGGKRCEKCFLLRLEKTAQLAKEMGFDFFTTTLTVSPHKNAPLINDIGFSFAEKYGVKFLPSDFKKKNGYKRSIELSKEYELYRQDYCGCAFSQR
jgi:predicted adenine nucleotide alpha hydrolase (AANH) superfamily ATPase